jgi:type III secretion protein J
VRTQRLVSLLALTTLAGCGTEIVVSKIDERQANRIIEVLAKENVDAIKGSVDTGREVYFTIAVPRGQRIEAYKTLNRFELPTPADKGYEGVFGESGLIPTTAEERAKFLQSLEGEIQKQLKLIEGILDAEVQIVVPEKDALQTTQEQRPDTTASVTIKYAPAANNAKPLSEPQVAAIVAAGVEGLTPDRVVVVMTQGRLVDRGAAPAEVAKGGIVVLSVVALLCLALIYMQIRLRGVRGRLLRLQTEIAKARRRPEGSLPNAGPVSGP